MAIVSLKRSGSQQKQQNHAKENNEENKLSQCCPTILGSIEEHEFTLQRSGARHVWEMLPVVSRRIQIADRIPHGSSSLKLELSHSRLLISVSHRSHANLMPPIILGMQVTVLRLAGLTDYLSSQHLQLGTFDSFWRVLRKLAS